MDDTKLYAIQDIEKLKEKIAVYKETLTTLKNGTSIEELLKKKEDFDRFKTQITHLEGLTKIIDEKQGKQIEGYEDKVKKIANQIELLNQTVEEMNQEISLLLISEGKVDSKKSTNIKNHLEKLESSLHTPNHSLKMAEEMPQMKDPYLLANTPPTYKQLQKLAGLALNRLEAEIPENPSASESNTLYSQEDRHFNQQYFQCISTHPSHMYNGLYKNILNTSSFYYKNESSIQKIPISPGELTENPPVDLANKSEQPTPSIVEELESINTTAEKMETPIIPIEDKPVSVDSDAEKNEVLADPIVEEENIESNTEKNEAATNTIVEVVENIYPIANKNEASANPITHTTENIEKSSDEINHSSKPITEEIISIDRPADEMEEVLIESLFDKEHVQEESSEVIAIQEEMLIEAVPEERKKEGFSSLFNFFKRRN